MTSLSLLALLLACGQDAQQAKVSTNPETPGVDLNDPTQCVSCHETVVAEWQQSMHSRAHQDKDPIFGKMRALRMEKQGEEIGKKCNNCHTPQDTADSSSVAAQAGVACAACHLTRHVDPSKSGKAAMLWDEDLILRGPHDVEPGVAAPAHSTGTTTAPLQDGSKMCLACHNATKNPQGVDACTTGPEFDEAMRVEGASCASCHMPVVDGPTGSINDHEQHASHAFMGPHRAWDLDDSSFLASGVALSGAIADGKLSATLINISGHSYPTGFPGRNLTLVAVGKDAQGAEVWRNFTDSAMKEDPQAVFNKVYVDAEGTPTPAAFATELKRDSRLKPKETRELSWELPDAVATVELKLVYRLAPRPLMKKLGLEDSPEAQPRTVTTITVSK